MRLATRSVKTCRTCPLARDRFRRGRKAASAAIFRVKCDTARDSASIAVPPVSVDRLGTPEVRIDLTANIG